MAWRRIAAATHPDRADGGDPAAFAAAAAAYTILRTRSGRGEVMAGAAGRAPGTGGAPLRPRTRQWTLRWPAGHVAELTRRAGAGRPWRLAARVAATAALSAAVLAVPGTGPAGPALVTGAATWLVLTARRDLAPGPTQPQRPGQHAAGRR